MKYKFVERHRPCFEVGKMWGALKISRSGYYRWRKNPKSRREKENDRLTEVIRGIHKSSRFSYGSSREHVELREKGYHIGHNRVARLMRVNKIRVKTKRRYKITTHSVHSYPVAANLLGNGIQIVRSNQVWVSDISYIWTQEGWLYLSIIMDVYSRGIVGWAMEERLTKELVVKAVEMACSRRGDPRGLIFHSDKGSQYASYEFRGILQKKGII